MSVANPPTALQLPTAITVRELMPKLRYQNPEQPTADEQRFIPVIYEAFPQLANDFKSYQLKPTGCGCAGKISVILSQDPAKTQGILNTVFGADTYKFVPINTQPVARGHTLVGTTHLIDATPEAWTTLFLALQRTHAQNSGTALKQLYNGVHVRDVPTSATSGSPRWLLLFY